MYILEFLIHPNENINENITEESFISFVDFFESPSLDPDNKL